MKLKIFLPLAVIAFAQFGCQPPQKEEEVLSKLKPEDLVRGETSGAPSPEPAEPSQPLSLAELQARAAQLAANNSAVFEENKGQFGPGAETILYRATGRDQQFYIRINGWSNVRSSFKPDPDQPQVKPEPGKPAPPPKGTISTHRVDISWIDLNPSANVQAHNPSQETRNFLGTASGDIMGVRLYGKVTFSNIYENIDVDFVSPTAVRQQIYTLKPGANIDNLRFLIEYADDVKIDNTGRLVIVTKEGEILYTVTAEQNGNEIPIAFNLQKKNAPKPNDPKNVNIEVNFQLKGEVDKKAPYTITLSEK